MIILKEKKELGMKIPVIKQDDFWNTNNTTKVIIYTGIQDLKKLVKGKSIETLVDHYHKTDQLLNKKDPIKQVITSDKGIIQIVYIVFCNKKPEINDYRNIAGNIARQARKEKQMDLAITFATKPSVNWIEHFCEGFYLGDYQYDGYQSSKTEKRKEFKLLFYVTKEKGITKAIKTGFIIANAQNMARNLANTPANYLTPKEFVRIIKKRFYKTAVSIKVYDKKAAKKRGMGAFLAVSQGSVQDPYLLELTINRSKQDPIVLVGKGVTFDTGGISIKPSHSMSCMKGDMGGAAAVSATMSALEQLGATQYVKALIPLVENMPSANAYKPGDVVTAMNKKTIEVINTDAEGRLILADALCLATTFKPKLIIDIATLTGACSVALGDIANAVLGSSQNEVDKMLKRQIDVGERLWQLPLYEEYFDYLKSTVADFTNCAENRLAGTSTAALFLQQFVGDVNWLHLDIASTMENKTTKGYRVKGMNGSGTRTLIQAVLATS
tara:strand:+ start:1976 stop:3466 length:1491 start_codon:yes stop_codon:yes gene_type:complete